MKKRGRYPKEFKVEAVRLLNAGEKPASELAFELGIKRSLLYKWRDQMDKNGGSNAFSGSGRPLKNQQSEITRLKQELARVTEERDI